MTKAIEESRLVDLSDDQLRDLVGYLWESIKRTDDAMGNDQAIEEMRAKLDEYKELNYTEAKRTFKAKLKAARKHAEVRGITFDLPSGVDV